MKPARAHEEPTHESDSGSRSAEDVFDKLHESARVFNGQQIWEKRSWSRGEPYGTGVVHRSARWFKPSHT